MGAKKGPKKKLWTRCRPFVRSKFKLYFSVYCLWSVRVERGRNVDVPVCCIWFRRTSGSVRTPLNERSPLRYHFSAVFGPTPNTLVNSWQETREGRNQDDMLWNDRLSSEGVRFLKFFKSFMSWGDGKCRSSQRFESTRIEKANKCYFSSTDLQCLIPFIRQYFLYFKRTAILKNILQHMKVNDKKIMVVSAPACVPLCFCSISD